MERWSGRYTRKQNLPHSSISRDFLKSCHQRGWQGKWCGYWKACERLNIQTDHSETLYNNRTLTHNLYSNHSRKPNHNLCSGSNFGLEQPGLSQLSSLDAHPPSNSGLTRERQIYSPNQTHKMPVSGFAMSTTSNQEIPEALPVFPLLSLTLSLCQRQVMVADFLIIASSK